MPITPDLLENNNGLPINDIPDIAIEVEDENLDDELSATWQELINIEDLEDAEDPISAPAVSISKKLAGSNY
jgi:hypothetical protein